MEIKFKNPGLILILLVATLIVYGCGGNSPSQAEEKTKEEAAVPVEAATVIQGSITASYAGSTNLEAAGEALVVAKVSGVVERIFVEEGDSVKAGQMLAKLDDEQYRLELNQAESILEKLSNEHERNESLLRNKVISQEAHEKTKSDFITQKAECDLAKLRLNYTEIRAPINGIVSQRLIKLGNMVKLDQSTFRITDFDPLWAILYVPEKEMNKLRIGYPARLAADAVPGSEFSGKILRISPVIDSSTGTFKVTVEVDDKTRRLRPGMFTRVQIIYDTHENALLVLKNGILTEDSETWAFMVKDGTVEKTEVNVGFSNATHVEILSGLAAGDTVVTTGLNSLKDGSKIKILEQ
jgi:membrane fusion protein (multidrug efflux system)